MQAILIAAITLAATCAACNAYCQSGPKQGTQCYSQSDAEQHEKQRR